MNTAPIRTKTTIKAKRTRVIGIRIALAIFSLSLLPRVLGFSAMGILRNSRATIRNKLTAEEKSFVIC